MFDSKTSLLVRNEYGADWTKIASCHARISAGEILKVAQYKPLTGEVTWSDSKGSVRRAYDGHMVRLEHEHLDLLVTAEQLLFMFVRFEGGGVGSGIQKEDRTFGFWHNPIVDMVAIPASQMTFNVSRADQFGNERITHHLLGFYKSPGVSATLFPNSVKGEDVEVTTVTWSGPVYTLLVPSDHLLVRRNDKICVARC
jgi:hypothetical protein